jgi:hypothetical protein
MTMPYRFGSGTDQQCANLLGESNQHRIPRSGRQPNLSDWEQTRGSKSMHVRAGVWLSTGLVMTVLSAACVPSKSSDAGPRTAQATEVPSWEGTGDRTIGFVSESGVFRVNWKTRNERPAGSGMFRLTVRSAISGRPIRIIADQRGEGIGRVDFVDDPRLYEFIVESANVEWWFDAEEVR